MKRHFVYQESFGPVKSSPAPPQCFVACRAARNERCGKNVVGLENTISASSGALTTRLVVRLPCRTTKRCPRLDCVRVRRGNGRGSCSHASGGHGELRNEKRQKRREAEDNASEMRSRGECFVQNHASRVESSRSWVGLGLTGLAAWFDLRL